MFNNFIFIVPVGWPGSSLCVACPHELGHLRSAPSVSTWKKVNKGAPSRPFALRWSNQLARNIKGDTPPYRTPWLDALRVVENTEWLKLCCPNYLVHTVGALREQLGFVLYVNLCELGQNSDPFSNVPRSLFIHLSHLKRVKAHWKHIKIFLGTFES